MAIAVLIARRHSVGKHEEAAAFTATHIEPFDEALPLRIEHRLQTLTAHVTRSVTIQGIADGHIICGNRLGDTSRGMTHLKKPACDFLPGANLRKCAVD